MRPGFNSATFYIGHIHNTAPEMAGSIIKATQEAAMSTGARVTPNIVISGYRAAADPQFVARHGITHIVKFFADSSDYPGGDTRHEGIQYLVLDTEDRPSFDIRDAVTTALVHVHGLLRAGAASDRKDAASPSPDDDAPKRVPSAPARAHPAPQILIHCHAGISRSATAVLLHLMTYHSMNLSDAMRHLRRVRPIAQPNPGFLRHLAQTDAKLHTLRVARAQQTAQLTALPPVAEERPYRYVAGAASGVPPPADDPRPGETHTPQPGP
jgi:hypothetical protein